MSPISCVNLSSSLLSSSTFFTLSLDLDLYLLDDFLLLVCFFFIIVINFLASPPFLG